MPTCVNAPGPRPEPEAWFPRHPADSRARTGEVPESSPGTPPASCKAVPALVEGSGLSDRLQLDSRLKITLWSAATALYLFAVSHFMPGIIARYIGEDLVLRALISIALISPLGVLMGFGFPTGMRLATQVSEKPTPWLWGVNGAAGVLATVIAIMISIAFGIDTTMLAAAACYACLPLSAALCTRQRPGMQAGIGGRQSLEQTA